MSKLVIYAITNGTIQYYIMVPYDGIRIGYQTKGAKPIQHLSVISARTPPTVRITGTRFSTSSNTK